jgi:single-stranded DNA-binding protein
MNKVMLVGRLTRDPELRTLPNGKPLARSTGAEYTNEHERSPRRLPAPLLRRS